MVMMALAKSSAYVGVPFWSGLHISLAGIHIGPCRTIHDGFHIILLYHLTDGIHIGDVKESSFQTFHLIDIGKDIMICCYLILFINFHPTNQVLKIGSHTASVG